MRDDFLKPTILTMAKRVSFLCSNPTCRVVTSGPAIKPDDHVNNGVAAHICAAAPGGKRYDADMSREERRGIENGIWLCQSCSKIIDSDEDRYTVQLLKGWKESTEQYVLNEMVGRFKADRCAVNFLNVVLLFRINHSTEDRKLTILTIGDKLRVYVVADEMFFEVNGQEAVRIPVHSAEYIPLSISIDVTPRRIAFDYIMNSTHSICEVTNELFYDLKTEDINVGCSTNYTGEFCIKALLLSLIQKDEFDAKDTLYKIQSISTELDVPMRFAETNFLTYSPTQKGFFQTIASQQPRFGNDVYVSGVDWVSEYFPDFDVGFLSQRELITGFGWNLHDN